MSLLRTTRNAVMILLLLGAPFLTGCDNDNVSGTGKRAILVVSFEPNPAPIDIDGVWRFVVFVSEINGVGVSIYGWDFEHYSMSDVNLGSGGGSQAEFEVQYVICGGEGNYLPGGLTRCSARKYERVPNQVSSTGYLEYRFFGVDDNGNEVEGKGRLNLR